MSGGSTTTRRLLAVMLREEWRLHARLFGGTRFAAFPLFVLAVAAGAFALLSATGTRQGTIAAGLHALIAFFGLQVGTVGLVGRDAMRNVLGDVTLVVFTSRTLPLSWRRLLGVFLLKDLLYYSGLFLAPIALAYTPLALSAGNRPAEVLLLWVTLTGAFALGVGASLTLVGLASRNGSALAGVLALGVLGIVWTGFDPLVLTPYGTYAEPTVASALLGFAPAVVVGTVGLVLFEPVESDQGQRRLFPAAAVADVLPDRYGLAQRTLLEIARSSGSVWKVVFSMGVLFAVAGVLLVEIAAATALEPSTGIAFGTLLGLGGFTTYAWLTQFDDAEEYRRLPLTIGDVLAGKRLAYLVLVLPVGLVYLAVAALWVPVADLAVGVVIFPPVAVYVYGLTAFVAGLSPTALLFDTPRFVGFGAGMAAVAVPLLVAALAVSRAPMVTTGLAVTIALLAAALGVVLHRRAGPRWDDRLRE